MNIQQSQEHSFDQLIRNQASSVYSSDLVSCPHPPVSAEQSESEVVTKALRQLKAIAAKLQRESEKKAKVTLSELNQCFNAEVDSLR